MWWYRQAIVGGQPKERGKIMQKPTYAWRGYPLRNYEGCYTITKDGRVYSIPRQGAKGKWLCPHVDKKGYCRVTLRAGGRPVYRYVHRLVLETFVGPADYNEEARHINGDLADNRLENLQWAPRSSPRPDSPCRWYRADADALGYSAGAAQHAAYARAGFVRLGENQKPRRADVYTRGGPEKRCGRDEYYTFAGEPNAILPKQYYIGPLSEIGVAVDEQQQEAYTAAGYKALSRKDAMLYLRGARAGGADGRVWTLGGPGNRVPFEEFLRRRSSMGLTTPHP